MSTITRTRTFTPQAQVEAALAAGKMVWIGDLLAPAPTQETQAQVDAVYALEAQADREAAEVDLAAEMFQASGAHLRKLAYTPTGRTRTTAEAQAALAEIARRAAKKAARKAAR